MKRILTCLYVLIYATINCSGQDQTIIDSILHVLDTTKSSWVISRASTEIAWEYLDNVDSLAYKYGDQAYKISHAIGDTANFIKSGRIIGVVLGKSGMQASAIEILERIYPIALRHNNLREAAKISNRLGLCYYQLSIFDQALVWHSNNYEHAKSLKDINGYSIALNNIGLVHYKLTNYELAVKNLSHSISIKEEHGIMYDLDLAYINLALATANTKNSDSLNTVHAREYIAKGMSSCEGGKCSGRIEISANFAYGSTYYLEDNFKEAISYYSKSYKQAEKYDDYFYMAESQLYLGRCYLAVGNPTQALNHFHLSEKLGQEYHLNLIVLYSYHKLSIVYSLLSNYSMETEYLRKYITLKENIYNDKLLSNYSNKQTELAHNENLETIVAQSLSAKRHKRTYLLITSFALILLAITATLLRTNYVIRKIRRQIANAYSTIQDQTTMLEIQNIELVKEVNIQTDDLTKSLYQITQANKDLTFFTKNTIQQLSHLIIENPAMQTKSNIALLKLNASVAQLRDSTQVVIATHKSS